MNLHTMLAARAAEGRPIRVGLIGAGKFGSMFLSQVLHTPGLHLVGIADLDPARARTACRSVGWPEERSAVATFAEALNTGTTAVTDDAADLIAADGIEVIIEATGVPEAGIRHALLCFKHRRHIVMVNVEADVLVGPLLARRAAEAGVVYAMAYGDQPALICEQVDWARACGLEVVAAGKGTLYMPEFHASTPDTVWNYYGLSAERAAESGMNAKMFNSFLDGTKSAIEMAAVANATGLTPAPDGLGFPPCAAEDLARTLIPAADGGLLHHKGQVEVVSSRTRDGRDLPHNLRWGVYVVFEAPTDYVKNCFRDYGMLTDRSGRYAALWRPYHLIGLELGISVAAAALRGEATGRATGFRGDVAATAKRDLKAGEVLDGEGGYRVWGKLMPAAVSTAVGALPIGLAHGVTLKRDVAAGQVIRWVDVAVDEAAEGVRLRREMEAIFAA
ncbi:MAG: SAF domain-containing protein [Rhodospirillales bacterium]|jgi:predicted homoserine dehydrogenase-like protein|nr:SAF domain-containing protein [Rhodospirillales bacterium]